MKIALITCEKLPDGTQEDWPLMQALEKNNIEYNWCVWDKNHNWVEYDACLLRSVWDYHENKERFNQWLTSISNLSKVINSTQIINWNQNKTYLAELQDFGITIAPTKWLNIRSKDDLRSICHDSDHDVFFLKPVIGADSSGTIRFTKQDSDLTLAQKHLDEWLPHVDMMLQPYLKSVESFGETSTIYINGQFTHAVRKIPKGNDYRVQDTYGATDISYEVNPAEQSLSKACLQFITEQFELPLYARFDFLHDDEGVVYLNEAELIEPSLFFHHCPNAANILVESLEYFVYCSVSDAD